ncbi:hypothetical protein TSH7_01365 [Azospirillum sp. TSH7]|uniref:hypothetical protein n=1 Tax=unclassified Azospirillum TaxID=2630922 RepID=UPI000D61496D|nr:MULTISPECIES: hypothetical protein [unclassified Azospirillum]PWC69121.1 hypothetical protein TSH7_01365 [Azospirillum sp. TSH7]PWC71387.1 hypothetical protein TSH20_03710 [Azospirillum sp. TSH20]
MPANPSLIDTLARDLWLADARAWLAVARRLDGFGLPPDGDIDPAQYGEQANMPLSGPSFRAKWEGQARAALRSLLEAGPTGAMLPAILTYAESQTDMDDDDGPDEAKCLAWDIAQGMNAALRAALEETGNV